MKTNKIKKEKDFDCIKMKNDIQMKLYEKIKNLTFKEQRDYISKMLNSNMAKI
jgi:hypothetical protein